MKTYCLLKISDCEAVIRKMAKLNALEIAMSWYFTLQLPFALGDFAKFAILQLSH